MRELTITRDLARRAVVSNVDQFPNAPKIAVTDPYTGEPIAEVAECSAGDVDQLVGQARSALHSGLSRSERIAILESVTKLLDSRTHELVALIALETGKSVRDCTGEVARAKETLRYTIAEARTQTSHVIPADAAPHATDVLAMEMRVPRGVVGAITPFNFPVNTAMHKVAPALAVGCPVIHKPAHQTPLTALWLRDLYREAGLPHSWLDVCTDSGGKAGEALVLHDDVAVISFTGSNRVGWQIAQQAPKKKVLLELGSNAPVIVSPSADIELAADKIALGAFAAGGQSCISVQRVIVHHSVSQELEGALNARTLALRAGDPFGEGVDVGPLITPEASQRVRSWVSEAKAAGGEILAGSRDNDEAVVAPMVVKNAPRGTRLRDQEVFGPVVIVLEYDAFDEAIALANETEFGLQAGVFTRDFGEIMRAFRELEFGGVLINDASTTRLDHQPYGGIGESGNTREGPHYAMEELTEIRYLSMRASHLGGAL